MELAGENLFKRLGNKEVIKGITIRVFKGEVVGLLGPNGAGKTTTFNIMAGILKPEKGKVRMNGKDITFLPLYLRARLGLGYLPQYHTLFLGLSVEDNLKAVMEFFPSLKDEGKIKKLLKEMGLEKLRGVKAIHLSEGEKRRLEITRVLLLNPHFLLLDEPFTGIDPKGVKQIQKIILSLRNQGLGILLTDHNVRETLKITDRAYLISQGEVIAEGSKEEILSHPQAIEEYFGESFEE